MEDEQALLARALHAIESGAAICLLGAGFSIQGNDATGNSLPSTSDLIAELKSLLKIPKEEAPNLSDVAEFAEEDLERKKLLNQYLIKRLTSTQLSEDQESFLGLKWRAVFTTNFDDLVERKADKGRVPITPATNPMSVPPNKEPIYYMHGRALDLREADRNPSLVISESNYLNLQKSNKDLYAKFFNEIVCARAIVIVGYSLKDLEIASGLLQAGEGVRQKTYIITSESDSDFTVSRLNKFGHILRIGLTGFVKLLKAAEPIEPKSENLQFLREIAPVSQHSENEAEDFLSLILTGNFEPLKFQRQLAAPNEPYCVERSQISVIRASGVNRFVVSSDFGNGKSAFLGQIATREIQRGTRVFLIDTRLPEVFEDIEAVLSTGDSVCFLVDDVLRYREVAIFIGERLHSEALLVATTRGDQDTQFEQIASRLGGSYRTLDLNVLDDQELQAWNALLERWGYWEERAGQSEDNRLAFLRKECAGETRSIILALFEDSRVAKTINNLVDFFLRDASQHRRAFAGMLVASLCQKHVSWSSVIAWLNVDEAQLRTDLNQSEVAFLFQRGRGWNLFTSAQLADYILRKRFVTEDRDLLLEVYSTIVLRTSESANDSRSGWDFQENLKELMRFRFLTRLFGNSDESGVLISRVYRRLSEAPRIRNNPQFWLQYAMSRMDIDDLDGAETYIKTSLSKAKAKGTDYSTFQIRDQQARLFLLKNSRSKDRYSELELRTALTDLTDLSSQNEYDVIYTMRSLPLIEQFLEEHIDRITPDIRKRLSDLVALLGKASASVQNLPRSQRGETRVLKDALSRVKLVLFNA